MKNERILVIGGTGALGTTLTNRYYNDNSFIYVYNVNTKCKYIFVNTLSSLYRYKTGQSLLKTLKSTCGNLDEHKSSSFWL